MICLRPYIQFKILYNNGNSRKHIPIHTKYIKYKIHRGTICAQPIPPDEMPKVLWVVDGLIYDNIVVDAEDVSEPAQVLIEKTLRKNGIDFGKLEGFNTLPGNIATSVYPTYGKLNGAIIITTENSKLKKKKEE